ncbi:hypothetical protein, partial [Adlercreutzia equolifaciens]|uniref:hypothetical protein n=1 Tax=Adlercreutzia equolifaciens TaxID=446660 RepID=UPI001F3F36A0
MERATGLEPANTSLGSYFHPELHFRENRSSPAKSLLEFSAWREVRQKVRQISTVFKTGHLQEKKALRWFLWERFRHRPSSAGENNDLELKRPREGPFPRHPPMIA